MTTSKARKATVYAAAVEIFCPCCGRDEPIPANTGSFMWDHVPEQVECPDCRKVSEVSRTIKAK